MLSGFWNNLGMSVKFMMKTLTDGELCLTVHMRLKSNCGEKHGNVKMLNVTLLRCKKCR